MYFAIWCYLFTYILGEVSDIRTRNSNWHWYTIDGNSMKGRAKEEQESRRWNSKCKKWSQFVFCFRVVFLHFVSSRKCSRRNFWHSRFSIFCRRTSRPVICSDRRFFSNAGIWFGSWGKNLSWKLITYHKINRMDSSDASSSVRLRVFCLFICLFVCLSPSHRWFGMNA